MYSYPQVSVRISFICTRNIMVRFRSNGEKKTYTNNKPNFHLGFIV
jgi:hypothetical protein